MSDKMKLDDVKAALALATARLALMKVKRWPAGSPQSKGGQFAPSSHQGYAGGMAVPQFATGGKGYAPAFGNWGSSKTTPPPPLPKGAKPHAQVDDLGKPVMIHYPTKPSDASTWTNKDAVATFTPQGNTPEKLNGVAMKPWDAPKDKAGWQSVSGTNPALDGVPFEAHPTKKTGAGVLILEPDGRVWLTRPTNSFGGYVHTFPKGTAEDGLTLQQNAIKEAFEETGLRVKITGLLGDFERDTSKARYFIARRVGGTPAAMGWESQAVRLAPMKNALEMLNKPHDKDILDAVSDAIGMVRKVYDISERIHKTAWEKQPRWPAGSPIGGQWKTYDADGVPMPPKVGSATNASHIKKAQAIYEMTKAGDIEGLVKIVGDSPAQAKWQSIKDAGGTPSSNVKWSAGTEYYAAQGIEYLNAKQKATASADKIRGPEKLSSFAYAAPKPGGSNPGAVYTDDKGAMWLVKGSNAGPATEQSKNEVLASKLLLAAGVGVPEMKLVDLEGKHGGGIGVASRLLVGLSAFDAKNAGHMAALQSDFAIHAWLGNYDVLGMSMDNTVINSIGQAVNIDPGGALLYRAQGKLKDPAFGQTTVVGNANVPMEYLSMRKPVPGVPVNSAAHAVFGPMTDSQLYASMMRLEAISEDTIKKLVSTYGPGSDADKAKLAALLIERRSAMLKHAKKINEVISGVFMDISGGSRVPSAPAAPAAPAGTVALSSIKTGALTPTLSSSAFKGSDPVFFTQYNPQQAYAEGTYTVDGQPPSATAAAFAAQMKAAQEAGYKPQYFKVSGLQQAHVWVKDGMVLTKAGAAALVSGAAAAPASPAASAPKMPEFTFKQGDGGFAAASYARMMYRQGNAEKLGKHITEVSGMLAAVKESALANGLDDKVQSVEQSLSYAKQLLDVLNYQQSQAATQASATPSAPAASDSKYGLPAGIHTPTLVESTGKAVPFYEKQIAQAKGYLENGNLSMLEHLKEKTKPNSYNGKQMHKMLDGMIASLKSSNQAAAAASMTTTVAPPPPEKSVGTLPAMPSPTGAKYAFDALTASSQPQQLAHNTKIDAIHAAGQSGDIKTILSMSYGINTYGKKQAKYANDVLAALGSNDKVTPGQKKNTHPTVVAANGGEIVITPPKPPATPPTPKPSSQTPIYRIPNPPDFANWNGLGKGLSSKPALNSQNDELAKQIHALAKAGKIDELKSLKFSPINPDGTSAGADKAISDHPSKNVVAYWKDALNGATTPYIPPPTVSGSDFTGGVSDKFSALAKAFPEPKVWGEVKAKAGRFAVLGKIDGDPLKDWNVKEISTTSKGVSDKELYKQSKESFSKLSGTEKQAIRDYTASGYESMNLTLSGKGSHDAVGYAVSGISKASIPLPTGTVLSRKITLKDFKPDEAEAMAAIFASEGKVVKDFGIGSTATHYEVWSGNIQFRITVGEGTKGLYVDRDPVGGGSAISANPGEKEVILPFGTKYYVRKVHPKGHKFTDEHGTWGKYGMRVVELVTLPNFDAT